MPAVPLPVAPERGTVTVRRATLKATNVKECLAAELPAFVAFYQPNADSTADDRFEQEVSFAAGRKQIHVSTLRHADLIVAIGPRNGMARSPKPRRQSRRQTDRIGTGARSAMAIAGRRWEWRENVERAVQAGGAH